MVVIDRFPCTFRRDPSEFWQVSKHYMTDTIKATDQNISLFHGNRFVNNPMQVCNIFNEYCITAVLDLRNEDLIRHNEIIDDMPSCDTGHDVIKHVTANSLHVDIFDFLLLLSKFSSFSFRKKRKKKRIGYDDIPSKILKVAAFEKTFPITNLINLSVEAPSFSSYLKESEVPPPLMLRITFCLSCLGF